MRQNETTYFVTSVTEGRRAIFQTNAAILCDSLLHYRNEGHYALHWFVVMPDHFHALLTPAPEISLERCVQFIKGGSAHRIGRGKIWQRGFNQQGVRDMRSYQEYVRYMEENPDKRGLRDWPFVASRMELELDPMPRASAPEGAPFQHRKARVRDPRLLRSSRSARIRRNAKTLASEAVNCPSTRPKS